MSTSSRTRSLDGLLSVAFNQDQGCFSLGTTSGFCVYNCEPFKETIRRTFDGSGISVASMLFRSNILALVGGGPSPAYPPNKVMLWDDAAGRPIGELTFRGTVRNVLLRKDRVVVVLDRKVLVYAFRDLRLLASVETRDNPRALAALSAGAGPAVLACPGLHTGQVRLEFHDVRRTRFVAAHASELAAISLSTSARVLATASVRGTIVRVFDARTGVLAHELRRGAEPCLVHHLGLSREADPEWVAATSDRGTVHVWALRPVAATAGPGAEAAGRAAAAGDGPSGAPPGDADRGLAPAASRPHAIPSVPNGAPPTAATAALQHLGAFLPKKHASLFLSERSHAQLRSRDPRPAQVAFGRDPGTLLVLSTAGTLTTAAFSIPRGGTAQVVSTYTFGI